MVSISRILARSIILHVRLELLDRFKVNALEPHSVGTPFDFWASSSLMVPSKVSSVIGR
jgi:hypothetical protein